MTGFLADLFFLLVFPGLLFSTVLGLGLSWLDRKVAAMVQWRVGPPPGQPFFDVAKLLGKETIVPAESWAAGFLSAPFFAFAAAGAAATFVWLAVFGFATGMAGDLIVVFYLLAVPGLATILGGCASGNPLGAVGASREMKLALAYELPLVFALLVPVFRAGTFDLGGLLEFQAAAGSVAARPSGILALVVAVLAMQAKLGLVPFDAAEAECEIGEGAWIEFSGPGLAMMKLAKAVLLGVLPPFLVLAFWGGGGPVAFAGKCLLVVVLFVLLRVTSPRVRVDQALRFFWGPATFAGAAALVLAGAGW